jgi:uncharacterized protein
MALIKCDECGAEVSSKAAACPKCGNPLHVAAAERPASPVTAPPRASSARKLGGGIAAFLVAIIAFMVYEASSSSSHNEGGTGSVAAPSVANVDTTQPPSPTPTPPPDVAPPPPPARAAAPINVSLDSLPGWPSEQPMPVSAATLYDDYEANEVAADNKYRGHLLMINGSVDRIAKDLMDRTYVALKVDGHFFGVNAYLAPSYLPTAASLSKGQMVTVVCVGDAKVITPGVKNCAIAVIDGVPVNLKRSVPVAATPTPAEAPSDDAPITSQTKAALADGNSTNEVSPITASFDCKKAHSTSEMLICGDADLAALDRDLATLYAQAKAAAPDKQAFAEMTRQNWNWRQRTCIDKTCLVTWYADQRQRFLKILNPPAQAAQEQGQVAPLPTAGATSFTTSFSCSAATYLDEKAICADPGLAAMDLEMAATYAAAARTGDSEKLASGQRDWLAVRRDCASDLNCLRHAYGVRTDQLRRWHG